MIILNNNNTNVNIPDYDDLVNKPSINGVVLEGNKTTAELGIDIDTTNYYTKREVNERIADSITGIENEFGNYYTKSQSDSKYQPKGNYLTSIPSEYVTETELNDAIAELGGSDIPYIVVQDEGNGTFSITSGDLQSVFDAYNNNKPYLIYLPNGISAGYYSLAETVQISGTQLQALSFAHTGTTHTWRYWRIYNNGDVNLYNEISLNYATETWVGNHYQTKGDYATTSYVDTQIGNINTILENILN